jgi:hypothetical protein
MHRSDTTGGAYSLVYLFVKSMLTLYTVVIETQFFSYNFN